MNLFLKVGNCSRGVIYSHNKYAYIHIYLFMQHHNDTIIDRRTMIKTQWQRQTPDKDAGRLLYKIFYLSSSFVSFERVVPSLRVRERAGDRTLLKYFDPEVMAVSVVSFSFSMVAQLEHWLSLLHLVYHLNSTRLSPLARWTQLPRTQLLCSIRRPYFTFKLPRGDMDMPPQLLPIPSDRDVSLPLSLEWPVWSSSSGNNCHPVQRSLSSGASVYESIMGSFFLPRPISSANFRPRNFLS